MNSPPMNLDDKLDQLPDDLAASLVDVPDGDESCECGLALPPPNPDDEPTLHRCECGRVWVDGLDRGLQAPVSKDAGLHVDEKMVGRHRLLKAPPTDGWLHAATVQPAHWAQQIDGLIENLQGA